MRKQSFVVTAVILVVSTALFVLLAFILDTAPGISRSVQAAAASVIPPSVTAINPSSAFNDLNRSVNITGTGFTSDLTNPAVPISPAASLGSTALMNVIWVNSSTLTATVPWGMDAGVYTLTVVNPDGGTGSLAGAFTVTQGLGQWNGGELFGGDVRNILLKPGDPNTLYANADAVGLFRSRDAGEHWSFISGFMNGDYAIDPLHPAWLYTYGDGGLYLSQDEGDTWIKLVSTWPDERFIDDVGRVYVSPHNPQVLFLSSAPLPGYPPADALGLIKSTDGGASWHIVLNMEGVPVSDLDFHPTDPSQMVLGTQSGQVFRSSDGGDTWSVVPKPPISYVGSITYNPYKPTEVWITFGGDTGIYKSVDAAFSSWQNVTPPEGQRNLWVVKFTSADSVYTIKHHSSDGGTTWHEFGPVTGQGEMCFNPDTPQIGYIGDTYYGVQKTMDGGQTWEIKSQGLTGMSTREIDVSQADPQRIYAPFSDWPGIFRSDDGANTWTFLPIEGFADVRVVREDPFDPQRIYAAAGSGFYVSTNGGENWSAHAFFPPGEIGMAWVMTPDPYQPGHLLVGFLIGSDEFHTSDTGKLYSSSNYGETWTPITAMQNLAVIPDIVFDPETPGRVYLSTSGTGLYRSTDHGNTWGRIDDPQKPEMQNAAHIAIATHPQHMLIVGSNDLYRSLDGGDTWTTAYCPPAGGVIAYMFLGGDSTRLYAATWYGLFLSSDVGSSWQSWQRAAGALGQLHITALDNAVGNNYTILYAATTGGDPGLESNSMSPATQTANSPSEKSTNTSNALLENRVYLPLVLKGWPEPPEPPNNLVEAGIYRFVQR